MTTPGTHGELTPQLQTLSNTLCEEAITRHRYYQNLQHATDAASSTLRLGYSAEIVGLRIALCHIHGWNPTTETDKEGKADTHILGYWQTHYPHEWADPTEHQGETLSKIREELIENHPELDRLLKRPGRQ